MEMPLPLRKTLKRGRKELPDIFDRTLFALRVRENLCKTFIQNSYFSIYTMSLYDPDPAFFPSFRRTTSPAYRNPFPLYGSTGFNFRISAAN